VRLLAVVAIIVAVVVPSAAVTATATHPSAVAGCGELQFIYNSSGVAVGGDAWCAGHRSWRVVAGFAATRYGTAAVARYGPWMTRWESVVYGTSKYPFARWVSYQTSG
jgi:hypothetical protein